MRRFVFLATVCVAKGFTTVPQLRREHQTVRKKKVEVRAADLIGMPIDIQEMENARFAFWLCFYGAAGAASAGRETIPIRYRRLVFRNSLKGKGPTLGGPKLDLLPYVSGFPEDLAIRDVEKVARNRLSAFEIVKKFPIEKSTYAYTHTKNPEEFLYYEAFALANKDANPLVVRAVFDSFTNGGDTVYAGTAQNILETYREDATLLAKTLNRSKLLGLFAFVVLISLVGVADYFAAYHLYHGWFPTWPGGQNFPLCIFDRETGPFTIPQYWMFDIPGKV